MIYLILSGRIGNQLFMYAAAKAIQLKRGDHETIIIDDSQNLSMGYVNSLKYYSLENVQFISDKSIYQSAAWFIQRNCIRICNRIESRMNERQKWKFEKKIKGISAACGVFLFENGYTEYPALKKRNILLQGYFQSEKYFAEYKKEICESLSLENCFLYQQYIDLNLIQKRESVCISIKVQHNVGNPIYDVCSKRYWEKAIQIVLNKIPDPLFFVCSDDIEYVKKNLIDCKKYDVIEQPANVPVHIVLAVMAQCKHFIIGNTSYGWWAQYLCKHEEKLVIAPSRWYGIDIPCDIYQPEWIIIEV